MLLLTGLLPCAVTGQGDLPAIQPVQDKPLELSAYDLTLVYANDFGKRQKIAREEELIKETGDDTYEREKSPPGDAEWIAEGWGGAQIRDGRLHVAPSEFGDAGNPKPVTDGDRSHMVVWNRNVFPADFLLEFQVNHEGSTNGLTLMFICATGLEGEDIFDLTFPPRRAQYPTYHSGALRNYTVSYWSRNKDKQGNPNGEELTNRMRKNPGKRVVARGHSRTLGPTNVDHKIRVLKVGGHIEVEVNGKVVNQWDDDGEAYGEGRIGLRCMRGVTQVSYDDFKVWRVAAK